MMNRRTLLSALSLFAATLGGCATARPSRRADDDDLTTDADDEEKVGRVRSKPPKGFFSGSRLQGGWSDEANEIERNLGVH